MITAGSILLNPQVKPWIDAQNTYTRSVLDKVLHEMLCASD